MENKVSKEALRVKKIGFVMRQSKSVLKSRDEERRILFPISYYFL